MIIGIESSSLQLKGFGIDRYNRNLIESLLRIKPIIQSSVYFILERNMTCYAKVCIK